ncbi:hypothetical protein ABEG63_04280 [Chryseobacterium sp. C39-AII1]|uniref:hypothetical protein n=1 Tax=Chryseobacterium sp. C39-AII1 TaxID=3080332 RepID=UPI00320941BD
MSNIGKIIRVNTLPPEGERENNVIYQVAALGAATYTDYAIDANGDLKIHTSPLPSNIATVDAYPLIGNVYDKEQSDDLFINKELFLTSEGKIRADKLDSLGITDLIVAEGIHTIYHFAAQYQNYDEFQDRDFIAIPNTSGIYRLYLYKGGSKDSVENYIPTALTNLTIAQVDGLSVELEKKIDKPTEDGDYFIKRSGGFTKPEILIRDTLQNVIDRGNTSTKPIIFQPQADERAGELYFNPVTYSYSFGNINPTHTGVYNLGIGFNTLAELTTGTNNTVLGSNSGAKITTGKWNTLIGQGTARVLSTGQYNTNIGTNAGRLSTTGNGNTNIGSEAGNSATSAFKNTNVGTLAGYANTTGNFNTVLGYGAGSSTNLGDLNVIIGAYAGYGLSGRNNVVIGNGAGLNESNSFNNKLIIHGNQTLTGYTNDSNGAWGSPQLGQLNRALITADFLDRWIRFNASSFIVGTPASSTNDININPDTGIGASKLYPAKSDFDYIQRGHLSDKYYSKNQIDSMLSSVFRPLGSKANFASLPSSGNREGDVWNLLDNGKNYVYVNNLNNTGSPGWDDLSGTIDLSSYATKEYVSNNFLNLGGNNIFPIGGMLNFDNLQGIRNSNGFSQIDSSLTFQSGGISIDCYDSSTLNNNTSLSIEPEKITINSSNSSSPGITGHTDFSGNTQDLDFTQASYVKKRIREAIPYKIYRAILQSSSFNTLTPIVLENTLGSDINWAKNNTGEFLCSAPGKFTANKTIINIKVNQVFPGSHVVNCVANRINTDQAMINFFNCDENSSPRDLSGDIGLIEIFVYN